MKTCKRMFTALLAAAVLLLTAFMTGCTGKTDTGGTQPAAPGTSTDTTEDTSREDTTADTPTDAAESLTLPILDEIDEEVLVGVSGSSLSAVRAAAKLLDWGVNTGLDTQEIGEAASAWLAAKGDAQSECLQKLEMVDGAYQKLLTDEARELLDTAGCADTEITWSSDPVEPIEAVMQAAGLRG